MNGAGKGPKSRESTWLEEARGPATLHINANMPLLGSPPGFGVFLFLFLLGPHTLLSILFPCFVAEEAKVPGHTGCPCQRHEWNSGCLAAKLQVVTYIPAPPRLSLLRTEGGFAQDFSQEVLDTLQI